MTNNIKYLEVSDFHYSPKWGISPCRVLVQCVRQQSTTRLTLYSGSRRPVRCTNHGDRQGGMNQLRKIIRMWLDVCPVVAIEGTPSHDGPGCYGPLEDMGVVVLRPG